MAYIKKYNEFLDLPNRISLNDEKRKELGDIISKALIDYYNIYRVPNDIVFHLGGKSFKGEYIRKARNNRTLFSRVIKDQNLKTPDELINFFKNNIHDLLHYEGKWFDDVYFLLKNTSSKGKREEQKAYKDFEEYAFSKGIDIQVQEPSLQEDLSGIDGFFEWKGKKYTIQVKPLKYYQDYKIDTSKVIVFCDGSLKDLDVDYLIATNEKETLIFRARQSKTKGSYFLFPKEDLLLTKKY